MGLVQFLDPETGDMRWVNTGNARVRKAYRAAALKHQAHTREALQESRRGSCRDRHPRRLCAAAHEPLPSTRADMRGAMTSMLLLGVAMAFGQPTITPAAELNTSTILIGGQARIDLSVNYRVDEGQGVNIVWPSITDTLTGKVEVAADSGVDTVLLQPQTDPYLFSQRRTITITSFDSGYWAIPPFKFIINGDTAETAPLLLTVNTVEVDTTAAIRDIKDIYELPFSWRYWLKHNWPYIAGGVAVLAAILLVVREVRRRRKRPAAVAAHEPPKSLHIRTLEALEEVGREKTLATGPCETAPQ